MKWGYPELLPWLLILAPVWWGVFALLRRKEGRLRQLTAPETLSVLSPEHAISRLRRKALLWLSAITIASIALARPQWGFKWEEVKRRGLDIIVVLDTSRSMSAEDIKPNRLQQAKWGIRDLANKVRGDRLGLVAFAGSSFLECPLTIDYAAFLMTLDDTYVGIIPRGGTAIEQALRTAVNSFEYDTDADRAIILITDGEDHEGNPLSLIPELKKNKIHVYSVGVGTMEGELIPGDNGGQNGFFKDRQGNVVKTALQEGVLEKLAIETGGLYVRSAPGDFGLERIFDQGIARLKRTEQESKMVKAYEDRFMWFIAASLFLLILEALLPERFRKKVEVNK